MDAFSTFGVILPWYPLSSSLWRARLGWTSISRPRSGWLGPVQIQAWCDFYLEEERLQSSHETKKFAAMLRDYGAPDCGNPLPNDQEGHFLLHPGGFIAGEIDRCLRPANDELEALRGERSMDRLGLLAHVDCPMLSARSYWSDEDVRFALAVSALEGRWEYYGGRASRVIVHAMRHGLLEPQIAPGLLVARRMSEEMLHPVLWSKAYWTHPVSVPPEAEASLEPLPPIDVGSWRSRRVAQGSGSSSQSNASSTEAL